MINGVLVATGIILMLGAVGSLETDQSTILEAIVIGGIGCFISILGALNINKQYEDMY